MPSASNELITAALTSAYKRKSLNQAPTSLTEELLVSSKQVLLTPVGYKLNRGNEGISVIGIEKIFRHVPFTPMSPKNSSKMAQGKNEDKLEEPRVVLWCPDKVTLGWKKSFHPGAGMTNLGNTCYLNSSLQALFHIPAMANWLLDEMGFHIERCEANSQNVAFCSICAMMRTLKMSLDRCNNIIKPSLIHTKLKCIGKTLMYGRQEDAHEFIKLLIDHMEKSYIAFRRAHKLDYRSKETTPLNQIFGGYLRQQVICPLCRYVSTTFSHFQDLVLDIRSVTSVDEALSLYFRKETLDSDNAYKCENCHKKVPATKRHLIERAPFVLLLQLKRFTISGGKITKHVNIQKTIDLSRYINGFRQSKEDGSYLYRLVSMVIHIGGSQHGGHYTAIAQTSNGVMFEFDDSSVHSIPLQSALLRNPYILFYEMVHKPKDTPGTKQVIRQSSERALLSHKANDHSSKSLPTSRSTSCMANGTLGRSDASQDLRKGLYNPKVPLPSQKEREKITFGLKPQSPNDRNSKETHPKLNKTGSGSFADNSCTSSSSCGNKSLSWPRRNGPNTSSSNHSSAGLLPCSEDSESEEETLTNGITNGVSSTSQKNRETPLKADSNSKNHSNSKEEGSSNGTSSGDDPPKHAPHPFLPRTLKVLTCSNNNNGSMHPNSPSKSKSASFHKERDKGSSPKESHSKNVPKINNHSVHNSVKSTRLERQNHVENVTDSDTRKCLPHLNSSNEAAAAKLEPQKSFSQESTTDKSETDSLESKLSHDSSRSDRSSRSVKKSIFSLLSCVSSTSSPDLSPNYEGDKAICSEKNLPKSNLSNGYNENGHKCRGGEGESDSDSDSSLTKRDRDNEEHDSFSPTKKCKPESLRKTTNGCEALSKIRYAYTDTRDRSPVDGHHDSHKDKQKIKNGSSSPINMNGGEALPFMRHSSNNSSSEENFSMEEKKSRHKWKCHDDRNAQNEPPKSFQSNFRDKKCSRLNPNVINVEWNKKIRDLSHKRPNSDLVNGESNHIATNSSCNGRLGSSSVIESLHSSSMLPFGAKVNKWNDERSNLDVECSQQKQETLKRTFEDMHNDEIDSGKTPKKRSKNHLQEFFPGENLFQKQQEFKNNHSYRWHNYSSRGNRGRESNNKRPHHQYNNIHRKFSRSNSWTSSPRPYNSNQYHRGPSFSHGSRPNGMPWHKNNKNFKRHNSFGYREKH